MASGVTWYEDSDEDSGADSQPPTQQPPPAKQPSHAGKKQPGGSDQGPASGPAARTAAQRKSRGADFGVLLQEAELQYSQSYHRHVEFLADDLLPLPADLLPFLSPTDPDQELELDLPGLALSLSHLPLSTLICCHPRYVTAELATAAAAPSTAAPHQSRPTAHQQQSNPTTHRQQHEQQTPITHAPSPAVQSSHPHSSQAPPQPTLPTAAHPGAHSTAQTPTASHYTPKHPRVPSTRCKRRQVSTGLTLPADAAFAGDSDEDEGTEGLLQLLGCGAPPAPSPFPGRHHTGASPVSLSGSGPGSSLLADSFTADPAQPRLSTRASSSSSHSSSGHAGPASAAAVTGHTSQPRSPPPPPGSTSPPLQPTGVRRLPDAAAATQAPATLVGTVPHVPVPVTATSPHTPAPPPAAPAPPHVRQPPTAPRPPPDVLPPQQQRQQQQQPPQSLSSLPRQQQPPLTPAMRTHPKPQPGPAPSLSAPGPVRHVDLELEALLGMGGPAPQQRHLPQPRSATSTASAAPAPRPAQQGAGCVRGSSGTAKTVAPPQTQALQQTLRPPSAPGTAVSTLAPGKPSTTAAQPKLAPKSAAAPALDLDSWLDSM
ncbi:MAG: hypothetical protein WDW38_004400 [Sanguina aurantia]